MHKCHLELQYPQPSHRQADPCQAPAAALPHGGGDLTFPLGDAGPTVLQYANPGRRTGPQGEAFPSAERTLGEELRQLLSASTAQSRTAPHRTARRQLPRHRSALHSVPAHSTRSSAAAAHGALGQSRAQSAQRSPRPPLAPPGGRAQHNAGPPAPPSPAAY